MHCPLTVGATSLTLSYDIATDADAAVDPDALVMNCRLAVLLAEAAAVALASRILVPDAIEPAAEPPPDANPSNTSTAADATEDVPWIVFAAASIMNSPVGDDTDAVAAMDESARATLLQVADGVADADTVATPSRYSVWP